MNSGEPFLLGGADEELQPMVRELDSAGRYSQELSEWI